MSFVKDYIDIPFADKGRDHAGCDCWGLVRLIYQEKFKITLNSYTHSYEDTNDTETLARLMNEGAKEWIEVAFGEERQGDVVLLRLKGLPVHVGIVVERGRMMHIHEGIDATVEDFRRRQWCHRITGIFRHSQRGLKKES